MYRDKLGNRKGAMQYIHQARVSIYRTASNSTSDMSIELLLIYFRQKVKEHDMLHENRYTRNVQKSTDRENCNTIDFQIMRIEKIVFYQDLTSYDVREVN